MPLLTDAEVDEELAADWAAIKERHTEGSDETPAPEEKGETTRATEKPAAEEKSAAEPDAAAGDRARDDSGKFVKGKPRSYKPAKEAKPAADAPASDKGAAPADGQADLQPQPGAAPAAAEGAPRDVTRPPSTWRPTARAEWGKLPESVRAEIHRRESDFMAGQSQLLPDAKFGSSMRQVVDPFRMLIESEGGTPEAAVQDLLRTAAILRTGTPQQKYQTMANVANRFGIDLRAYAPRPQGQPGQGQPGPASAPAQQQFRDPRVDGLLQQLQSQESARVQREQVETETSVTRWMNETDAKGQPRRPYVTDVINEMSALIPQLRQVDPTLTHTQALEQAYERAIWAHPEIRVLLKQQERATSEAQRLADSQQRAREARRGASVNTPRRASIPAPAQPGSMEDTIAETARELGLITS